MHSSVTVPVRYVEVTIGPTDRFVGLLYGGPPRATESSTPGWWPVSLNTPTGPMVANSLPVERVPPDAAEPVIDQVQVAVARHERTVAAGAELAFAPSAQEAAGLGVRAHRMVTARIEVDVVVDVGANPRNVFEWPS